MSDDDFKRLMSRLEGIADALRWIAVILVWFFIGGCNGCFHVH